MIALFITLLACWEKGDDSASDTSIEVEEQDSAQEEPQDTAQDTAVEE